MPIIEQSAAWFLATRPSGDPKRPVSYRTRFLEPDWPGLKRKVMARDNFRCRCCGAETRLTVHHVTYLRQEERAELLCDLLTLCWECHQWAQGMVSGHFRYSLHPSGVPDRNYFFHEVQGHPWVAAPNWEQIRWDWTVFYLPQYIAWARANPDLWWLDRHGQDQPRPG